MNSLRRCPMFALLLLATQCADAQPPERPEPRPLPRQPPVIQPEARQMFLAFLERYQSFKSYSDTTIVEAKDEHMMGERQAAKFGFQARMTWQRPDKSRFEGTNSTGKFLATSNGKTLSAQMDSRPGVYVQRIAGVWAMRDPLLELNLNMFGQSFFFERGSGNRVLRNQTLTSLTLGPDTAVDGTAYHVLLEKESLPDGTTVNTSIFIGVEDGLMHRLVYDMGQGENRVQITETHSDIQINPKLDESTWQFTPAPNDKPTETFLRYAPRKDSTKLKIGDEVIPFTAKTTDGQTLSLTDLRGKVVLLYFYAQGAGGDAIKLAELVRKEGARGLTVVGVAYGTKADTLPTDAEGKPLPYPFILNGTDPQTDIMALQGTNALGWIYLIDRQGKLVRIGKDLSDLEFSGDIERLLKPP